MGPVDCSLFVLYDTVRRIEVKAGKPRRYVCHLPFFGTGRNSTERLCPVAAMMRCSVRTVACVRPRSRRAMFALIGFQALWQQARAET
jgi:hypothetical protein